MKYQKNLVETILYFRNRQIENHLFALELASKGNSVVVDTPFYQHQLFIKLYINDEFTRKILFEIGTHDMNAYVVPDVTIYIKTTTELVKTYLKKRHGEREWEEDRWFNFISKMPLHVDEHMNKIKNKLKNYIELDRGCYDFSLESDKNKLFSILLQLY